MKRLKKVLEPLRAWVRARPLTAGGLLLLGWSVALLMAGASVADRNFLLNVFAAIGTLGAAVAAFRAVDLTRLERAERKKQEEEARRPYLQVVGVEEHETPTGQKADFVSVTFVNISQYPMLITDVAVQRAGFPLPDWQDLRLLVSPGESRAPIVRLGRTEMGGGELTFYFHYAVTGPAFHRLRLPTLSNAPEEQVDPETGGTPVEFLIGQQEVEEFVDPPEKHRRVEVTVGGRRRRGRY